MFFQELDIFLMLDWKKSVKRAGVRFQKRSKTEQDVLSGVWIYWLLIEKIVESSNE